jgi:hypothetical protein
LSLTHVSGQLFLGDFGPSSTSWLAQARTWPRPTTLSLVQRKSPSTPTPSSMKRSRSSPRSCASYVPLRESVRKNKRRQPARLTSKTDFYAAFHTKILESTVQLRQTVFCSQESVQEAGWHERSMNWAAAPQNNMDTLCEWSFVCGLTHALGK